MSEIAINTTQNVNINFTAANLGLRLGAFFIDLVVKISYFLLVQWLIISNLGLNSLGFDNWTVRSIYIIFFLPVTFYTLVQESMMEGQTIGKKLVGIKVVKIDGYQASFIDYLTRWVFRLIDVVGSMGLVAIISISVTKIYQRLGDMAAGTAVITLKNKINISHTILTDISKEYVPSYPQVIRFSDNDIRIIKETFLTAQKNNDQETIQKLIDKIEQVSQIKPSEVPTKFINTIIKDYNYYTGDIN